jgi:small conductance mechanosensitive channel
MIEIAGYELELAQLIEWGGMAVKAILIFVVGWLVSKWAHRLAIRQVEKRGLDLALGRFLASLLQWSLLGAAALATIETVGIEVTGFMAVFASAGLAVGLALQGNLSHFASGVMILIFRPFTVGDVVEVGGKTGKVQEVGLFATVLHTPGNHRVIVPNGSITGSTITNYTAIGTRRVEVDVGVAYGEDPARIVEILTEATRGCPLLLEDPPISIAFVGLGASSIDFRVLAFAKASDWWDATGDVRTRCYNACNEHDIDIPYQQVVIHNAQQAEAVAAK